MSKKRQSSVKIKKAEAVKGSALTGSMVPVSEKNPLFFPVLLALAVIPLIVHVTIVSVDPNEAALVGVASYADFFSRAKAFLLLLTGAVLLVLGILYHKKLFGKRSRMTDPYLAAGGIFVLFTLLSAVFSSYSSIAFWGAHDRAEGAFAILCYIILFFYSLYAYRTERDGRRIVIALGIVVSVSSILGIFQYFGHDLLYTDLGKALAIFPWDRDKIKNLHTVSDAGRLYGTFFHWNYVGSFAAITVPIFSVLALAAKSWRSRPVLGGIALLSLWLLFGSTSRAGIVGVAAAFVFGVIFFARIIADRWKIFFSCFAVMLAAFVGLNFASGGKLFARIPSLFSDAAGIFQSPEETDYLSKLPVKDVSAKDDTIVIVTQQNDVLKATLGDNTMELKDGEGQIVPTGTKDGKSVITDQRFRQFSFGLMSMGFKKDSQGISVSVDGKPQFFFRIESDGSLRLTNAAGTANIDSLETPPSFGFEGKERLGSARGYIWSRAIPMIPGNLLLGSGPDTFVLNFPQNDLLGKYWAYGTTNMLVDKPHDLYLQILLGEGGIALLAFLAIVLLYVIDSVRLYALKKEYGPNQVFGAAACLGVVGYLFAGLFNDSVVSVAPVFWIILGVGVAVNLQNRRGPSQEKI